MEGSETRIGTEAGTETETEEGSVPQIETGCGKSHNLSIGSVPPPTSASPRTPVSVPDPVPVSLSSSRSAEVEVRAAVVVG